MSPPASTVGVEVLDDSSGLWLPRPKSRSDCICGPRPCPWVGCKYHLYLEIKKGKIKLNHKGLQPWEIPFSCTLDVADFSLPGLLRNNRDLGVSLEIVGMALGITRERVRQIEQAAIKKCLPVVLDLIGLLESE